MSERDHAEAEVLGSQLRTQVFEPGRRRSASIGCRRDGCDFFPRELYRDAYKAAVELVYRYGLSHPARINMLLPLGFLWRHRLEMALKDLIRGSRELLQEDLSKAEKDALRHHDLVCLWNLAQEHLTLLGMKDTPDNMRAGHIIKELHRVDPDAAGFRYPFKKDGGSQTLTEVPGEVDLGRMHRMLTVALEYLEEAFAEMEARDDAFFDFEMADAAHGRTPTWGTRRRICERDPSWRAQRWWK